jgi:outer membrane protein OmpA-like peptidoglycan-associated protein
MEDISMRRTLTAIVVVGLTAATPFAAQAAASKQENIGIGAGAIIGAAAGGPVGLFVGAAVGASIGDRFHSKSVEIESLNASLDESRGEVSSLERDVAAMNADIDELGRKLEHAQRFARPEVVSLLQAGIAMDLLFRTDESVLADSTGIRLNELATTIAAMPGIHVRLDGFADERGDETYNQQLSQRRVDFVREQLVTAGIEASRISTVAHGESPAQDASVDSYALERRVSLTLFLDQSPSLASVPE